MPVRPLPIIFRCPVCGWSKTYVPPSDALLCDFPSQCNRCGNPELEQGHALTPGQAIAQLGSLLKEWLGK